MAAKYHVYMNASQIHREEIEEILTTEEILEEEEEEEVKGSDVREDLGMNKKESGEKAETSEMTPKFTVTSHTINNTSNNEIGSFYINEFTDTTLH